jgi:hypothetical protein
MDTKESTVKGGVGYSSGRKEDLSKSMDSRELL